MMRFMPIACAIPLLVSCASNLGNQPKAQPSTPEGRIVEQAILWEGEIDQGWDSVAMKKLVSDKQRFEAQDMTYLALEPIVVFGHRAAYVSYLGLDTLAGPNAILKGTPKSIAAYISKHHGAVFHVKNGVYISDYTPTIRILIEQHPDLQGASIIIGTYVGPS